MYEYWKEMHWTGKLSIVLSALSILISLLAILISHAALGVNL